jgi:hypothetical protein
MTKKKNIRKAELERMAQEDTKMASKEDVAREEHFKTLVQAVSQL